LIARVGYVAFRWIGAATLLLAIICPFAALLYECVAAGKPPAGGWGFTPRQWALAADTLKLAVPATVLAILFSLPVAAVLGAGRRTRRRWLLWTLVISPLLLPPTVLAFGWSRAFARAGWTPPDVLLCVWTWAAWLWPVPALLLGAGWARSGRAAYESSLMDAGRWRAFYAGGLSALRAHLAAAAIAVLILCLADYNVPHACNLQVYATELLAWATNYPDPVHVLWRSAPLVVLLVILAAGLWACWRRWRTAPSETGATPLQRDVSTWPAWCTTLVLVVAPQLGLQGRPGLINGMTETFRTYGVEIAAGFSLALAGGVLAVWVGLAVSTWKTWDRSATLLLFAAGFLPAALLGKALAITYVRVPVIYDHWPILALVYAARFAWIGALVGWLMRAGGSDDLERAAGLDGATPGQVFWRVRVGLQWPLVLCGWLAASGFCLAELAAASQVALPQYGLLSMILIEKFHRFEEQMLVSISLTLQLLPLVALAVLMLILGRRGSGS
jgi:ABC-type Fe3+ transport system permease subunit